MRHWRRCARFVPRQIEGDDTMPPERLKQLQGGGWTPRNDHDEAARVLAPQRCKRLDFGVAFGLHLERRKKILCTGHPWMY